MILLQQPAHRAWHKRLHSLAVGEVVFLVGALGFVLLAFFYADGLRATLSGQSAVRFSQPSGFYPAPFTLHLVPLGRASEIRYTLDGSNPDSSSPRYAGPLHIDKTTVIKAVAMQGGSEVGQTQTQTYFVNETSTLPVVSLITDPANLWDPKTGIYVPGIPDEDSTEKFIPNERQRGPEWHRAAYLEFFDPTGQRQFALEGVIKIHGNATRRYPQKSLRFCAAGGEYIKYKFFEDSPVEEYKCILLRNGGNDWVDTMLRDGLVQSLVSETSLDIQHSQPALVYLNGEYWGIHNIRDAYNDYYFHTKYGLDRGGIVIIFPERDYNGYPIVEEGLPGDERPYVEMLQFVQDHDMADPANYAYVETLMDVDNYIDYMVFNIHTSNGDWGDSNVRIWRYNNATGDFRDAQLPYGVDGRWRWIVYDLDEAMTENDIAKNTLDRAIHAEEVELDWTTILFRNLLKNSEFRSKFIDRYIYHYNYTFTPERVIDRIDAFQARLRPEIERHSAKWGGIPARTGNRWISFKDIAEWDARVQVLRDFAVGRQEHALHHVVEQFALAGTVALRVNIAEGGRAVYIGDLRIEQDGWTGRFVRDWTYPLRVESKPGYKFAGWEGTLTMSDPTKLTLSGAGDVVLTATFEKNLLGTIFSAAGIQLQ